MKAAWIALVLALVLLPGCWFLFGAAAGGGGVYEYTNKRQLDALDRDLEEGKIDRDEYLRRKKEIEGGSLVY